MDTTPLQDDRSSAVLSDDREYRYRLTRRWDAEKPTLAWIMLNPSTADETDDDPTIRRCLGYAEDWGYGSIVVGNLFALRATDPSELRDHPNPVGPDNDDHLRSICRGADRVIAAWGTDGDLHDRGREVVAMLDVDLEALNTTQAGHPTHPLYQPADAEPEPFAYDDGLRCDGGRTESTGSPEDGTEQTAEEIGRQRPSYMRELLEEAKEVQEPVTEIEWTDEDRTVRVHAIQEHDGVAHRVLIKDHRRFDDGPTVSFAVSRWDSKLGVLRDWSKQATGRLGGPKALGAWERYFTVFNAALGVFNREVRDAE